VRLELPRLIETDRATFGELSVDGAFECLTLEDRVREIGPNGEGKIPGETAIPAGTYQVALMMSPRLGKIYPRLLNVPPFSGILIHKGNRSADTHGCILVGSTMAGPDLLTGSTVAFDRLYPKLQAAVARGEEITITITNAFGGR